MPKKKNQLAKKESNPLTKDEGKKEMALNYAIARMLPTITSENFAEVVELMASRSGIHPQVIIERIQLFQQLVKEG